MKLSELRKMAALDGTVVGAFHHSFGVKQAAELVVDIDAAIQRARRERLNMKLSELRKGADIPALKELVADIDAEGEESCRKAVTTGWNGALNAVRRHCGMAASIHDLLAVLDGLKDGKAYNPPSQREAKESRAEYWRGRDDGHKALASQLMGRMESVENTLRNAQDTAKAMHSAKDGRLDTLQESINELRAAKQERGWGAPATEERQALTARLRAQEEFAQTLRRVLDETRSRVDAVGEEDRGQKARIHTCEQELARLGKLANDNVCMRVELGNELKQRIENIERGVTSPAQLVPDMLKRVQALEAKVTRLDNEAAHYRGFEPNKKGKT
jgi:hypothetical protein